MFLPCECRHGMHSQFNILMMDGPQEALRHCYYLKIFILAHTLTIPVFSPRLEIYPALLLASEYISDQPLALWHPSFVVCNYFYQQPNGHSENVCIYPTAASVRLTTDIESFSACEWLMRCNPCTFS